MLCMVELGAPTGYKLWDGTAPDFERSCKCNLKCDTELYIYTISSLTPTQPGDTDVHNLLQIAGKLGGFSFNE